MLNEMKHLIVIIAHYNEMFRFTQHEMDFMASYMLLAFFFVAFCGPSWIRYRANQPPSTTSTWPCT